jgi:hypothetical protein
MKSISLALFLALICAFDGWAVTVEGVQVSEKVSVADTQLSLNGTAVRVFRWLGIPVKIYVAAFYTPAPLRSAKEVMASSGPMQFDFTFLRDVSKNQVAEAWSKQIAESVDFTYGSFDADRDRFVGMFGALKSGGTQTVQFVGEDTVIIDQGVKNGTIAGRNFQKAFLSMWFGENPVSPEIKAGLLGK